MAQCQPIPASLRPASSSKPRSRFIHCTPPPAAPLTRLSITEVDDRGAAARRDPEAAGVGAHDLVKPRRGGGDVHERGAAVELRDRRGERRRRHRLDELQPQRRVDPAHERARVRHELHLRLHAAARGREQLPHLRLVAVRERRVAVEVPAPLRVVGPRTRRAPAPRAAGHRRDEDVARGEAERVQRVGGQHDRGGEAPRLGRVSRRPPLVVLRDGAHERAGPPRGAVGLAVDPGEALGVGEAEVRRKVHRARLGARGLGRGEHGVEQRGRGPVRRRGEDRDRTPGDVRAHRVRRLEAQLRRQHPGQVREARRHRGAGLARRYHGLRPQVRMPGQEPQQLAGHVPGPAQDQGRDRRRLRHRPLRSRSGRAPASPSPAPPARRGACGR